MPPAARGDRLRAACFWPLGFTLRLPSPAIIEGMNRLFLVATLGALLVGQAAAETAVVQASPQACRNLVAHRPGPDVQFRPGVDARGRPVAPADLAEERALLPSPVMVEIEVEVLRRYGFSVPGPGRIGGRAILGAVEVDADGGTQLNGRPLPIELRNSILTACSRKSAR
jgi:hypothetical protein